MFDRRHINEEPPRQRNVRSNARALFGDGLFGDLNQNLLALAQQIRNRGLHAIMPGRPATTTSWRPPLAWRSVMRLYGFGRFFRNHYRLFDHLGCLRFDWFV